MYIDLRRCGAAAALGLALAATPVVAGVASATPVAPATERLAGQIHDLASVSTAPIAPGRTMDVDILLAPSATSVTTGETPQQLETALYTVGGPQYHHFLTPDEYAAQFATPSNDTSTAVAYGTAHGLSLVGVNTMRDTIQLTGTAAQVEATFATPLVTFSQHGRSYFANTAAPTVPAGIGVLGVTGLDDTHTFTTPDLKPAQTDCEAGECIGDTTPQDLWTAYDQPTANGPIAPGTTDFGQGEGLAVIGEGQTAPVISDLRQFESENGLPQIPVTVTCVNQGTPTTPPAPTCGTDNSGLEEWDIDTQSSTGMAPDASSLTLYFGTGLDDTSLVDAIDAWTGQNDGPLQANMSIDGCEGVAPEVPGNPLAEDLVFQNGFDTALQEAVDTGRTLFNSSGDVGSGCPYLPEDTNGVAIQPGVVTYPTSSPHVVSVGGTVLYGTAGPTTSANGDTPITGRALEYGWTFGGGGVSQDYPEPAYQTGSGLVGIAPGTTTTTPCVTNPADGNTYLQDGETPPAACRAVPDIAAQSGDVVSNGYNIVNAGTDTASGGTSLSSPLSMGMWARIQAASTQVSPDGVQGNGFADYALYAAAAAGSTASAYDPHGDFFDVGATGNSQTIPTNNGLYVTHTGYDEVTGLGVMDVNHLLRDIDANTVPLDNVLPVAPAAGGSGAGTNGGGGASTPASVAACYPLFTGTAGSDSFEGNTGGNPQLDVMQGDMHVVQLNASGQPAPGGAEYLQTIMTIQDLTDAPAQAESGVPTPSTYNEYYMLWTFGGTTYFTSAQVDTTESAALGTPQVTYGNGTLTGVGTSTQYSNAAGTGDIGQFNTGTNGTVVVDIPLTVANVGTTDIGATLTAPNGKTFVEIGNSNVGGSLQPADSAGPQYNYTLGETCSASGLPGSSGEPGLAAGGGSPGPNLPEAPWAIGVPLVGAAAGYGVVRRRRRAQAA